MRKTGNYGWWASGALTVALLAVPAFVFFGALTNSAEASSGFNCSNPTYTSGGTGYRKCNLRQIAIDTIISYYNANKTKAHRNYGCNWYRVLRAFDSNGRWNYAHDNSSVRGRSNAPSMDSPPANLARSGCAVTTPFTTAEAAEGLKKWAGWGPVIGWLGTENGREKTKTCPGGGTILESQQCPEPPEMLTCWDGSEVRYQPAVWRVAGVADEQARDLQRRAECPPKPKPTITLSVGADVTEGKAHTWTLHASEAPVDDLEIRVDFRAVNQLMCSPARTPCPSGRHTKVWVVQFGKVGLKRLGGGLAEIYQGGKHFTLPAGHTSVSFTGMGSLDDLDHTDDGTVTGYVIAGQGYVLGTPSSVSAKVLDDDDVGAASTITINMPTVTVREGKWAQVGISTPSQEGERRCVTGRVTLTPASGGQPDSSDYRTYFLDREITLCSSIRGDAWFGYVQAYRDSHNDSGERLILGFTQTGGDGELVVNEGSVTITNDGPLPAEWLARVGHGVAGQVVESVASRVFANRSPGEVEGSLGAMPAKDRPVTDGDALLMGSSASMTSHDGALAMWARADGTSFSSMTGGDGDVTTGHAGVDYVDGPLMFGLALARSEAEGTYRGGANDLYHLESDLTAVYPYTALKLGPGTVWAAAGYGEGESSLSREGDDVLKGATADIDWRMAAAGFRVGLREAEDYSLDLVGDAFWQGIDSGKTAHHEASSSESTRVRGGVEGGLALGPLTLSPRALLRWDGGDVDDDRSVELGGGLAWAVTDALEVRLDGSEAMDSGSGWTSWSAGMSLATGAGTVSTNYARDGSYTLGWGMTFDGGSVGFEAEPGADRVSGTMSLRF